MSHGPPAKHQRSESEDECEISQRGPPPPDGGWGWVVVFASFMIHIVTDGVTYSFGVFYDQFLDYFKESKSSTAWILSILVGVTLCSGPISSAFVNRYGCRPVTIAGAIVGGVSLVASAFAPNVVTLYFTVGIGTGLGFGFIYLPAIVSVTMYFEKYRSLATGIAVCGSGFGTFVCAPLIEWLISEYGWRGAMLITAALIFNCIFFGAMFRPLEEETVLEIPEARSEMVPFNKINGTSNVHTSQQNLNDSLSVVVTNGDISMQRPHSIGHFAIPSVRTIPNTDNQNGSVSVNMNGKLKSADFTRMTLSQPMLITAGVSEGRYFGSQIIKKPGPMQKRDVFYQGSLMNIPQYKSKNDLKDDSQYRERRPSSVIGYHSRSYDVADNKSTACGPCSQDTKETMAEMLDFSLFKDPIFIIFSLSNFCTSIGFNIPYVYIVAQAKERGMTTTESSYLLAIIGIANTLGRIVLGYLSDKPWVNRLWVYNVCLTVCGIATFISAFCLDFTAFAIYSTVFGFTIGAYVGLTSVILVDLLGLDKLTNAFGLLLLFQGIASLIGSPLAGWLYDVQMSYDPGFQVAGVMIAVSGLMLFVIPRLQLYLEKKRQRRYDAREECEQEAPLKEF